VLTPNPKPKDDKATLGRLAETHGNPTNSSFDKVIEAILGADPEAVQEHRRRRGVDKKSQSGRKQRQSRKDNPDIEKPRR
jgi:hypothetical protein